MLFIQNLPSHFRLKQAGKLLFSQELDLRVDELWRAALSKRNSRLLFNGLIFSAQKVTPEGIEGAFVEYRYLIAQQMDPRLKKELNIKPVSLLGFLTCEDGILFGKRQDWVATRPNAWGFLPSHYVTPDTFSHDGQIDFVKTFLFGLKTELNIDAHYLNELAHHSLILEETATMDRYSLVMRADIALSSFAVKRMYLNAYRDEYAEIVALPPQELDTFLYDKKGQDIEMALALLDKDKYFMLESRCA